MPRNARKASATGIYHVVVRGVNRQDIFHDDDDRERYLLTLKRISEESNADIMGYCLMSNHVHLMIREGDSGISNIMKRMGASYAYWYNLKYGHAGHVFQGRFKSEAVEDNSYLVTLIRYIHSNPVKAHLVARAEDYPWSSCRGYYGGREHPPGMTKTAFILGVFADSRSLAIDRMKQFESSANDDECMEYTEPKRPTMEMARQEIVRRLHGRPPESLREMPADERNGILRDLKATDGLSLRQIAMVTGLTIHQIHKA